EILKIDKKEMTRALHEQHELSDIFVAYLLSRNRRVQEDLVDQLFNSSEKRLARADRKSTRLNSSHLVISYAVFCLKKKKAQGMEYQYTLSLELLPSLPWAIAQSRTKDSSLFGVVPPLYLPTNVYYSHRLPVFSIDA